MIKRDKANTNPILSSREKQLLRWLAQGKADHIAEETGGGTDQISLQRKRLIESLQIRSQEHLSTLARRLAPWGPSKDVKQWTAVDISRQHHARWKPTSDHGVLTMSEGKKVEKTQAKILSDAFEGMKGRRPKSDQELNEWLATDEGQQATMFEPTLVSRWGETGHA